MASIHLYAELLFNIRQVTVFAILPSDSNEGTRINLLSDQKTLKLQHKDQDALIELPTQVSSATALTIPSTPTKELSFRLSVSTAASLPSPAKSVIDTNIPWPASRLTSETKIACQSCGNSLTADVTVWKDLPSGGWADMMDFWHCHKPSTRNGTDDSVGSTKGYAAANDLGPQTGVGLVDISHFLLNESDCIGIQVCHPLLP